MSPDTLSPMLNVGSSTLEYRTVTCPHIDQTLFRPLAELGVNVLNIDLKDDAGVDIVGNILDITVRSKIAALGVKAILCNNLLEHVTDIPGMCMALAEACPEGGLLCLSVPHAYPFHPDPIDNGFRPSLAELEGIFRPLGLRLEHGEILDFGSYAKAIASKPMLLPRDLYLLLAAPFSENRRKVLLGNYAFLHKHYQVACAIFRMIK
jgi:hypothetical protein